MPNLTDRIRKISPEAADLLEGPMQEEVRGATRLDQAFIWSRTEQGSEYWADISLKLGE